VLLFLPLNEKEGCWEEMHGWGLPADANPFKYKACSSWGSGWAQSRKGMFSRAGFGSISPPIELLHSFFALSLPSDGMPARRTYSL